MLTLNCGRMPSGAAVSGYPFEYTSYILMRFADQHHFIIGGIFYLLEAKAFGDSPA